MLKLPTSTEPHSHGNRRSGSGKGKKVANSHILNGAKVLAPSIVDKVWQQPCTVLTISTSSSPNRDNDALTAYGHPCGEEDAQTTLDVSVTFAGTTTSVENASQAFSWGI